MEAILTLQDKKYRADLNHPLDISIPLRDGTEGVNCFYAPLMEIWPVKAGDFVGSTAEGGLLNFMNVKINPHGNGTHTECVGHIAKEPYSINQCLRRFHFPAKVVSIYPTRLENGDRVILREQVEAIYGQGDPEALVIRTMPNTADKLRRVYSGTNPPYMHHAAIEYLVEQGVQHLLLDLPSVDREEDEGKLLAHKAFWRYPGTEEAGRLDCTISELVFVPDHVKDDYYLLNIQIASFELDVSPSKPVLYPLELL
jgi:arylformamidase